MEVKGNGGEGRGDSGHGDEFLRPIVRPNDFPAIGLPK